MIRRLYGRDPLLQVLLTFGVAIVIRESVEIVWGPRIQVFLPPMALSGSAVLWGVQYPVYRLAVLALSIVIASIIWLTLRFTDIGLIVRAGSSDRNMVAALGINVRLVFTSVFVMGAMMAALAGMLVAPLRSVYPDMGNDVILYAFVAVIVGGLGSYQGAIAGALLVGFAELLGVLMFPGMERAFVYVLVALVMALKPSGLFGRPRQGNA
jgi:branched-chain amino acid transport system permease protein